MQQLSNINQTLEQHLKYVCAVTLISVLHLNQHLYLWEKHYNSCSSTFLNLFFFLQTEIFTQTKLGTKEGNTITALVIVACYAGNKRALNWGLIV